jgi:hypothetical protein
VSARGRQHPSEILITLTKLSGISLDTLQSPTQLRRVGQVRAAAAHLLRNYCGLLVKQVAPLLGRSDQTVCELSRKARGAMVTGGTIAELIGQTILVLGATTQEPPSILGIDPDCRDDGFEQVTLGEGRLRRAHLGMRACTGCGTVKPLEAFRPKIGKKYRTKTCMACRESAEMPDDVQHPKRQQAPERTCTECGSTKPIDAFQHIKSTKSGYFGRCRACRNARARERYHSTLEIRAAEIARSSRNRRARLLREGPHR